MLQAVREDEVGGWSRVGRGGGVEGVGWYCVTTRGAWEFQVGRGDLVGRGLQKGRRMGRRRGRGDWEGGETCVPEAGR